VTGRIASGHRCRGDRAAVAAVALAVATGTVATACGPERPPIDGVFVRNADAVTYLVRWRPGGGEDTGNLRLDAGQTGLVTRLAWPKVDLLLLRPDPCGLLDVIAIDQAPSIVTVSGGAFGEVTGGARPAAGDLPSSDACLP
jgi:hypothetical protein